MSPGLFGVLHIDIRQAFADQYSCFFRLQVCLNLFFLLRSSCLSSELLVFLENFSPRNCKFSFSVSHSCSNHFFCDLHIILLPLAFNPASCMLPPKFHLLIQTQYVQYRCYHVSFTAASNLDWTVCDLRPSLSLSLDLIFQKSLLYSVKMSSADVSKESWLTKLAFIPNDRWLQCSDKCGINELTITYCTFL